MGNLDLDVTNIEALDWDKAFDIYQTAISSGTQSTQLKATLKLAQLSKHAPHHILVRTVPILANLLANNVTSIQKVAAFCLKLVAFQHNFGLASVLAQSGVVDAILSLLPQSDHGFRSVLIKLLWGCVNFCDDCRLIVARNSGLEIVFDLLCFCSGSDRMCLLEILSALALLREARRLVFRLRRVKFLVEAVRFGSLVSRERACQAVGLLGVMRSARSMLVEKGVIPALVELLRVGDSKTKIVAGNSLGVISSHVDFIRLVADAGAIPLYAELLQGPDPIGREIAEDAFCILAVAEANAVAVAEHLVRILREGDDESKLAAADVLWDLSGYKHSVSVVRSSGAIPILVELLKDGNSEIREKVSGAIAQLSYNEADQAALGDAGAVRVLLELWHDDSEELKENAVEALVNFAENPLQHAIISEAVDAPSFEYMQNRVSRLRISDDQMVRSLRRMSVEQLTWDPDLS